MGSAIPGSDTKSEQEEESRQGLAREARRTKILPMKKTGGGFGYVIALVALVILLLLSAKAWKGAAPAAAQALKPGASGGVPDHGQTGAGEAIRSGNLPDMKKMGQNTDAHVQQVNEAAHGQD
jgi:hypothetical protein